MKRKMIVSLLATLLFAFACSDSDNSIKTKMNTGHAQCILRFKKMDQVRAQFAKWI